METNVNNSNYSQNDIIGKKEEEERERMGREDLKYIEEENKFKEFYDNIENKIKSLYLNSEAIYEKYRTGSCPKEIFNDIFTPFDI